MAAHSLHLLGPSCLPSSHLCLVDPKMTVFVTGSDFLSSSGPNPACRSGKPAPVLQLG